MNGYWPHESHAAIVATSKRWWFVWRRLHCLQRVRVKDDSAFVDVGYCLDRYTTEH